MTCIASYNAVYNIDIQSKWKTLKVWSESRVSAQTVAKDNIVFVRNLTFLKSSWGCLVPRVLWCTLDKTFCIIAHKASLYHLQRVVYYRSSTHHSVDRKTCVIFKQISASFSLLPTFFLLSSSFFGGRFEIVNWVKFCRNRTISKPPGRREEFFSLFARRSHFGKVTVTVIWLF